MYLKDMSLMTALLLCIINFLLYHTVVRYLSLATAPSEAPTSLDGRALSATEAIVWWLPVPQNALEGYQVSR